MHLLFTNNSLHYRAGTELYLRDVALRLRRAGHEVSAFSLEPGEIAVELEAAGIEVVNDPRNLSATPDLIHGQHVIETTLAALAFPTVPVISFCHGPKAWQESPCRTPNVVRWVAIDEQCRKRLVEEEGIDPDRVTSERNFVDLERFRPRERALPPKPTRALVFSNTMGDCDAFRAVSAACGERGIDLEVMGSSAGTAYPDPENRLPQYDLVFAKAKAAMEAVACGCAVICVDWFGAGELITPATYRRHRDYNFGYATMKWEPTAEHIGGQIDRYDPDEAGIVSGKLRSEGSLDEAMTRLTDLYTRALATPVPPFDAAGATMDFLLLQSVIARGFYEEVRNAPGQTLTYPRTPLPEGSLRVFLQDHLGANPTPSSRLHDERERRIRAEKELRAESGRRLRLEEKLARVREKSARLQERLDRKRSWWRRLTGRTSK